MAARSTPATVDANVFAVTEMPRRQFIQYDAFDPELPIARRRIEAIHHLQVVLCPKIFTPRSLYDGKAILFSPIPLKLQGGNSETFDVNLSKKVFRVTLKKDSSPPVRFDGLNQLVNAKGSNTRLASGLLQQVARELNVLQLILRQVPSQTYATKGNSFFSNANAKILRNGIQLWRGFFQSIRPSPGRLLVNVDVSAAAFYTDGPMIDAALAVLGFKNGRELAVNPSHRNYAMIQRDLFAHFKGVRITISVSPNPDRIRTVKELIPEVGNYKFILNDVETTIEDHYRATYRKQLAFPKGFGVRISPDGAKQTIIIPMEYCNIVPGQLYKRKLPESATAEMVKFATLKPSDRHRAILSGVFPDHGGRGTQSPILQYPVSEYLRDVGMEISVSPVSIAGSILAAPQVRYRERSVQAQKGSWNVVGQKFAIAKDLMNWAIINFESESIDVNEVMRFAKTLATCCNTLGMNIQAPSKILTGTRQQPDKIFTSLRNEFPNGPPQLLLVILPQNAPHIRLAVKQLGDTGYGIATQCLRINKVRDAMGQFDRNGNNQYFNNVALKLNARLDGVNSNVDLRLPEPMLAKQPNSSGQRLPVPFMVIGIDVTHPGPGVQNRPSIASLVFSTDNKASVYQARLCVQPPRREALDMSDLGLMIKNAVATFGRKNKAAVENIIVFRDGVSEGEYEKVLREEFSVIKDAATEVIRENVQNAQPPKVTFIVVTKRHHVRFFPQRNQPSDPKGNCLPGFTTDTAMASPGIREFYLVSHAGLLGTSRPSHYIVLEDEIFNAHPDGLKHIQQLSYELCFVYVKATRSISIPAPVYYADMSCSRANFYFRGDLGFSDEMSDTSGFDLSKWKAGFRSIHQGLRERMFFI